MCRDIEAVITRRTRNAFGVPPRGFESLSLRQMAIQVKKRVAKAALFILQFSITGFQTFLPILKKSK